MGWLFEDPTMLIAAGVLVEGLLAVALVRSGRGMIFPAMVGVAALVAVAVLVEALVVTEREEVEATLDSVAEALEANDVERVVSYIDPSAANMRSRAAWAMSLATITRASVRNLEVRVRELTSPPTAQADFIGNFSVRERRGEFPYETYVRRFIVYFQLEGDRWLMTDYEVGDLQGGPTSRDAY